MGLRAAQNTNPAELIASFDTWTRIHVQVRDANTLYISRTRGDLEVPAVGGQQGGLSFTAASGIVSLPWIGTLYVKGSAPNSLYNIEIFPEGVNIGR